MSALNQALGIDSIRLNQSANTWTECFEIAGEALVSSNRVSENYIQDMIDAFIELGPYMVLAPGIALAHARPSENVKSAGLSIVTLAQDVVFGSDRFDPVRVVIGLAALDHDGHIELMAALSDFLMKPEIVNILLTCQDEAEVRALLG